MKKPFLSKTSKLLLGSIVFVNIFSFYGCNNFSKTNPIKKTTNSFDSIYQDYFDLDQIFTEPSEHPMDIPEPLQAPIKATDSNKIIAKAIAKTSSYKIPSENIDAVYVNVEVTWQPVTNAKEYWLFKDNLPNKENVNRDKAYKITRSESVLSTYFLDGRILHDFYRDNFLEQLKKNLKDNLKVDTEYKYKVFAVDKDKKVLSESENISTTTLPAISAPINISISETNTIQPLFKWENSEGLTSDGYFVSIMPPINFGKEKMPNTSVGYAFWTTYRDEKTKLARYGEKLDESVAYKGTVPFDLITPLKIGGRYSLNVTSVKTNTKDMRTATAISKAWSESKLFSFGSTNNSSPTSTPTATPSPSPSPSSSSQEALLEKLKRWQGF